MADGTISSKLQLDGEQQYKKALNDAYRSLRVLRSELKAETAELGRNASEQDKARAKMQSLQKQIQQQEKIVKTLEKALADSKKEYADNAEVQDKWEEKLNKARAALADMQNALGGCQDELSNFNDEMKEAGDSSGKAAQEVVSFSDSMKSIGNIVGGIAGGLRDVMNATLETVQDIVAEMMGLMGMAWASAGEWKDIQEVWGGNLESIERVFTAMELQGVDPSKVTSSIQKLIANVHSGNEDAEKALKELGITESQFTSHWDLFVAVMNKLSKEGATGGKKWDLATMLFGEKKGSDVMFLLNNWEDAMNKYDKDILGGGMHKTSAEIEHLDEVGKKINEVRETWETVQETIGAKLSDVLQMDTRAEEVLTILQDVGLLLNGEGDKKEIVLKLSDDITTLLTGISESVGNLSDFLDELGKNLQNSDNPLVQFIGKVISGLSNLLDWLATHGTEITSFLEQAMPWILRNKILEATTGKGIGGWFTDIVKLGVDFAILGKLFGISAGTAIGETAASFGASIGAALKIAVPALAFLGTLLNPSSTSDATGNNTLFDENGNPTNEFYAYGGTVGENGEYIPYMIPEISGSGLSLTSSQREAAENFWDAYRANPSTFTDEQWDAFESAFVGQEALFDSLNDKMDEIVTGVDDDSWRDIEDLPASWFSDISGALKNLSNDKYRGETDEDLPGKIGSAVAGAVKSQPINISVYVDGEAVTQSVNRNLGSLMQSGLFG